MREGWDDGELRPWHYKENQRGRKGRWGIPTMALQGNPKGGECLSLAVRIIERARGTEIYN